MTVFNKIGIGKTLKSDMRPRILKEKTIIIDYIEMRVFFVFKYISKAKRYKLKK